jgi:hypothetical protein
MPDPDDILVLDELRAIFEALRDTSGHITEEEISEVEKFLDPLMGDFERDERAFLKVIRDPATNPDQRLEAGAGLVACRLGQFELRAALSLLSEMRDYIKNKGTKKGGP